MTALRTLWLLAALAIAACAPVQPDLGASVGTGGADARVGVDSGRVSAGVGTGGPYARARVVDTRNVDVSLGTGGVGASVGVGGGVRLGFGLGGLRIGI